MKNPLPAILWLTLLFCAPLMAAEVQLQNVRTAVHEDFTRVVLDLSGPSSFRIAQTGAAGQVELIIPRAAMSTAIRQQLFVGTPIYQARVNTAEDGLHLILETGSELSAKAFALKPYLNRGDRIVLDLFDTRPANAAQPTIDRQAQTDPDEMRQNALLASSERPAQRAKRRATSRADAPTTEQRSAGHSTVRVSATWEHEWAVESGSGDTQKFESVFEPRVEFDLSRRTRLTAIARVRADATGDLGHSDNSAENYSGANGPLANNEHAELSLRELYLDTRTGDIVWRFGKQQVVWGEADGIKVMDVVNPQSFREFILDDFDDSRIPLWMVNAEMMVGDSGSLQLLWIPDTTYHELAEPGSSFVFTSSLYIPRAPQGLDVRLQKADRPDAIGADSDAGLRYAGFAGGWDFSLNYFYHYLDMPVPYQSLDSVNGALVGVVTPEFERNHLLGATVSNVFGPFTLRSELVYNSDSFHISRDFSSRGIAESAEISTVVGLDWQWDARNTLLSAQWFQSHLLDYEQPVLRTATEHTLSLLYQRDFRYETWKVSALGLYSLDREDRWLNLKLSHMLRDNVELWLGGDFFAGDREGLYGQFGSRDRVLLGVEWGL